jgi:glycine/D-amino acid oxidase-like deaminating enzyme/nitrite reductase/ring-hydroxylating ferredoxin subunit
MGNLSVWHEKAELTSFPPLTSEFHVDVAIIGGGITGITAAYFLSKAGKKVAVLEARKIGEGSTGYSTGNLYATVGGEGMHSIADKFDDDKLRAVIQSRQEAVNLIEGIIKEYAIDCDFKRAPWSLFTVDGENQKFVEQERDAAIRAGLPVVSTVQYSADVKDGFSVEAQAQFNPLQYVVKLANAIASDDCRIFENSRVVKVEEGKLCVVETEHSRITASKVVMATHTPKGLYAVHTTLGPYREYAVAARLHGDDPVTGIYWEMQATEHYSIRTFDTPDGRVIMVLGEMHKVGQKEENLDCFHKLEAFLRKRFNVGEVIYRWSAQQYKPSDSIPYIGISTGDKHTYIATGFAADGLTYGTLAAKIISDDILVIDNKWKDTYKASRLTPLASAKNFVKENANVAYEMVKDWLVNDVEKFSEVRTYEGKIMEIDGSKHGVHRDGDGKLHIVSAVCPHMGCIVHWNTAEQSWDCPCHGSRFSKEGEVLEGPAIHPLKKLE